MLLICKQTVQLYLNENFQGGETTFLDYFDRSRNVACKPLTGMVLIFEHRIYHEVQKSFLEVEYSRLFGASDPRVGYDWIISDSDPTDPNLGPKLGIRQNLLVLVGFHVVLERVPKSDIPEIDKRKFLVPSDITIAQFKWIILKRIQLAPEKAIFLFVNKTIPTTSATLGEIYAEHKDEDSFLYMAYAGENTFG
ncbi:unnamed protein product [Rotaria magnacalcarata]|uniref:Autophagy-related protein n=1 Tax=Rotaria magnacalcarata TaxID=392030 RepID=A0A8S2MUA7_9BILA|nr:unnamed protein product [Rotaria magnacalcarata]